MRVGFSVPLGRLATGTKPAHSFAQSQQRSTATHHRLSKPTVDEPSKVLLRTKRTIDVLGASFGLLILAPLLIGIAIAIKATSTGPIFFRQKRYGFHNRRFWIYKFRTMHIHLGDQKGTRQTTTDDPRVTPLGRILRKSSLDELPQLINVLKGDMSLVGPRPHVPGMLAGGILYEELTPYYFQRHHMRPGITGLAQVSGYRGGTTVPLSAIERLDRDLQYIETWSLWLDARILVRTVIREFISGSGD
jgi:lipopolysaccharide/colanic/teichoic acid biosynthesis glycosyltransferase